MYIRKEFHFLSFFFSNQGPPFEDETVVPGRDGRGVVERVVGAHRIGLRLPRALEILPVARQALKVRHLGRTICETESHNQNKTS